jgi:hypothetical protein
MNRFVCRTIAATTLLLGTAAFGQVKSYVSNNLPELKVKGDPNKVLCVKQEELGSRVRTNTICMTIHDWQMREKDDREFTQQVQAGVCVPQGGCNDAAAMLGTGPSSIGGGGGPH